MADKQPRRVSSNPTASTRDFGLRTRLLLNESERQYMYAILREYRMFRELDALVLCLRSILDTPVKMDLLKDVRRFVDASQLSKYDQLVPYDKMAHPWKKDLNPNQRSRSLMSRRPTDEALHAREAEAQSQIASAPGGVSLHEKLGQTSAPPRIVRLYRDPSNPLDFEIRTGSDEGRGIFISSLRKGLMADCAGLREGDEILEVNGVTFDTVSPRSALKILTEAPKLVMLVQSKEKASGSKLIKEKILWYDVSQKCVVEEAFVESDFLKLFKPNSQIYRKVNIDVKPGRHYLGFNIRGGSEYDLGIYVSRVDPGGLGERRGVRVGDRLMVVNGISFNNISHYEAVKLLRLKKRLFLILLFVGFYPICKEVVDEHNDSNENLRPPKPARAPQKNKRSSRHVEDTRLDQMWKSFSDGEIGIEDEDADSNRASNSPVQFASLQQDRRLDYSRTKLAVRKQTPEISANSGGLNQADFRREVSGFVPISRQRDVDQHEARTRTKSSTHDDVMRFSSRNPQKPLKKMTKSKSLKDLSTTHQMEEDFSELLNEKQLALRSIESAARNLNRLNEDEVQAILRHTKKYLSEYDIGAFMTPITAILDTGERQDLLSYIRPVIRPKDLPTFDLVALSSDKDHDRTGSSSPLPHPVAKQRHLNQNFILVKQISRPGSYDNGSTLTSRVSDSYFYGSQKRQLTLPVTPLPHIRDQEMHEKSRSKSQLNDSSHNIQGYSKDPVSKAEGDRSHARDIYSSSSSDVFPARRSSKLKPNHKYDDFSHIDSPQASYSTKKVKGPDIKSSSHKTDISRNHQNVDVSGFTEDRREFLKVKDEEELDELDRPYESLSRSAASNFPQERDSKERSLAFRSSSHGLDVSYDRDEKIDPHNSLEDVHLIHNSSDLSAGVSRGGLNQENGKRRSIADLEQPHSMIGREMTKQKEKMRDLKAHDHETNRGPQMDHHGTHNPVFEMSSRDLTSQSTNADGSGRNAYHHMSDEMNQSNYWNWEADKTIKNSTYAKENVRSGSGFVRYHSESVPSINSALQLLDRVLLNEEPSTDDAFPGLQRSSAANSKRSRNHSVLPDSDPESAGSNMTSRRGSYDVTVPSAQSSLKMKTRPSSKSPSSPFVDSGLASDFRSTSPVLAGFSLHRNSTTELQASSGASLTSIKRLDDYNTDSTSSGVHMQRMLDRRGMSSSQHIIEVQQEPITVYLDKSHNNLGLCISGGSDSRTQPNILIEKVIPGGAADDEGTLKAGMQILSIDDASLRSATHEEAIKIIRTSFKNRSMPVMKIRVLP